MPSPSTKPRKSKSFDCGRGTLRRVIVSRSFTIEGRRVRVPGLVALEYDVCGERFWLDSEILRTREVASIKRTAAA